MIGGLPDKALGTGERIVHQFHPHWRTYLPASALALGVVFAAVLAPVGEMRGPLLAVACGVAVLLVGHAALRRVSVLYALTTDRLVWRRGVLRRVGVEIPLEQINTVSYSQNLLERALGYGDLTIESAGAKGESRLIDIPDPQAFQSRIYAVRDARKRSLRGGSAGADRPAPSLADAASSRWEQLERLAELRRDGLLDEGEFARAKRELLGE